MVRLIGLGRIYTVRVVHSSTSKLWNRTCNEEADIGHETAAFLS